MPNPTHDSLHVNGLLTNISVGWIQSSTDFVSGRVFPSLPVQKQTDIIPEYDRGDLYRIAVEAVGPGGAYPRAGYRVKTDKVYRAEKYGLDHPIDDEMRANADAPFDPEMDGARWLGQQFMLHRENNWVTSFFSTGIWSGSSDGADLAAGTDFTAWSNAASDPVGNVLHQRLVMKAETGFNPNKLVCHPQVWADLREHPDIVDRVKHTSDGPVTKGIVARLFELDEILVASAVKNSGDEGSTGADSFGFIAGKHALLAYAPRTAALWQPTAGYTFVWNGLVQGAQDGVAVGTLRDELTEVDLVRGKTAWDQKVVSADLGVLFPSASTK